MTKYDPRGQRDFSMLTGKPRVQSAPRKGVVEIGNRRTVARVWTAEELEARAQERYEREVREYRRERGWA